MKAVPQLSKNIAYLDKLFKDSGDAVSRRLPIGSDIKTEIYVLYIDDMINRNIVDERLIANLLIEIRKVPPTLTNPSSDIFNFIKNGGITTADIKEETDLDKAAAEVLSGNTLLLIDGCSTAVILSTKGFPKRGISSADTEVAVQGSKEAFVESFRTNTVLLRRRIRDVNFKIKQLQVGRRSKTDVALCYLADVVRSEILLEAEHRINQIDIDAILDSGYIEQLIEDRPYSPFPQMQLTERPDKAAAAVFEGRIVIIVDNTPFVIILPSVLSSFYQASEDYYQRFEIMSFVRILRYIAGFLAVTLPGFYLAATTFHPSMIPMALMFRMSGARETVPLPGVLEILIMELAFETLREAGIRLPSAIGSTLGIVGGIIIGQAAVDAGIVSPVVVIIISLTAICSFAIPNIALVSAYRIMKYLIIFSSALFGLYGLCLSMLFILIHLSSLKSFGIPYLYPFTASPDERDDSLLSDTFFRFPVFKITRRPVFACDRQKIRQKIRQKTK